MRTPDEQIRPNVRLLSVLAMAGGLWAQNASTPAIAANPRVELKGKILRVQLAPGSGMPFLEVEREGAATRVLLGSMRYLMEHDFRPKAGGEVVIQGYRAASIVVAITVKLVGENKVLRLRDEEGRPLWMGHSPHAWRGNRRI